MNAATQTYDRRKLAVVSKEAYKFALSLIDDNERQARRIKALEAQLAEKHDKWVSSQPELIEVRDSLLHVESAERLLNNFSINRPGQWCGYLDDALGSIQQAIQKLKPIGKIAPSFEEIGFGKGPGAKKGGAA